MAEHKEITVKAQLRQGRGKNDARRTRRAGLVPVVVYGGEGDSVAETRSSPLILKAWARAK
jgi:ribosomal protein L25 (general stress protein Ctc)